MQFAVSKQPHVGNRPSLCKSHVFAGDANRRHAHSNGGTSIRRGLAVIEDWNGRRCLSGSCDNSLLLWNLDTAEAMFSKTWNKRN